jgi:hypothetical protein
MWREVAKSPESLGSTKYINYMHKSARKGTEIAYSFA